MKRWLFAFFLSFWPFLTLADTGSALSFAPPPSDNSVIFLGNIFGIVDGVLTGSGSQIMGSMFSVFNAAVLALGGIVIIYTIIVGTMNTAQEGEMLGHKWSSLWIPVRSTTGLALLIPKASGYCLMQVFIMWVVVQGVGAADKVWSAALSYLNRGGVIVQAQMSPYISLTSDTSAIANGAAVILSGQVCMLGLQKQLENYRQTLLNSQAKGTGPCYNSDANSSSPIVQLCNNSVPDFTSTVNAIAIQSMNPTSTTSYELPMPNFTTGTVYAGLNGVCGTIKWNSISNQLTNVSTTTSETSITVSQSEMSTATMSRAIAVQQMYMDLLSTAQNIVNNDPQLNTSSGASSGSPFSSVATEQFGLAYLDTGSYCPTPSNSCTQWGADPSSSSPQLLTGPEFQNAITAYNGIMAPTLNLIAESGNVSDNNSAREFIRKSEAEGWILAGSYFFDLVRLNGSATKNANQTDANSGLDGSSFSTATMVSAFSGGACSGAYGVLCSMFAGNSTPVTQVVALIDGTGLLTNPLSFPNVKPSTTRVPEKGVASSVVYGYINNGIMIQLPDQPGLTAPSFKPRINIAPPTNLLTFPKMDFGCGGKILGVCIGRSVANAAYNWIFRPVMDILMDTLNDIFNIIVMNFLQYPLTIMATVFQQGVAFIQDPGTNPIVGLALMGTAYINYSMQLWMDLIGLSIIFGIIPGFISVLALVTPLLFSWLGIMVGIGFMTAYYIPFLPYMIFTFGAVAWLMAVIEAMVAGPVVALGITHPEGEGILGKGEQALMILLNVFLRPAMMIIGYIAAIALCYVSVWIINAGFSHAAMFIEGGYRPDLAAITGVHQPSEGYVNWASVYAGFFALIMYVSLYMTVVEKAFTLIHVLPDKVLRWIGGQQEQSDIAQWAEQSKQKMKEAGTESEKAGGAIAGKLKGHTEAGIATAKEGIGKLFRWNNNESEWK